nr:hypothetical protein [Tanacetum cinerariifolium]
MIELVKHTVKNDMVIYIEKSGMMMLVVEIDYVGRIADVVDKYDDREYTRGYMYNEDRLLLPKLKCSLDCHF